MATTLSWSVDSAALRPDGFLRLAAAADAAGVVAVPWPGSVAAAFWAVGLG